MWLPLHTPAVIVPLVLGPSPQSIWQVWVSFAPASVNDALIDTVAPVVAPSNGAVIVTTGRALPRVSRRLSVTAGFAPSSAVSVSS